jgi:hypothetical protein
VSPVVIALFAVFDAVFGVIQRQHPPSARSVELGVQHARLHRWHHSRVLEG